jgi:Xaa-Pro dipeptidase
MNELTYRTRLTHFINAAAKEKIDVVLFYSDVWRRGNVQYICGWREAGGGIGQASALVYCSTGEDPVLFVGFEQVPAAEHQTWIKQVEPFDNVSKVLMEHQARLKTLKVGIVGLDIMPATIYKMLKEIYHNADIVDLNPLMYSFRRIKEPEELQIMREASAISDEGMKAALNAIHEGVSEEELAFAAKRRFAELGADPSFCPVVGFGENAAQAMRHPGERRLKRGEIVLLDFGALYRGYAGDTSRTIAFGHIGDEMKKILDTALQAHDQARQVVRPGILASEVDKLIRLAAEKSNLGKYVIHDAGHGVGIDQEENFPIGPAGSQITLVPNMTFTIEAGIYVPNVGGVRIEDVVAVTANGVEILNKVEHNLAIG